VCTPPNTCFLGPTKVQIPNGITIGSAVFAGFTTVTDRPTDRPRYTQSVTVGRIYTYVVLRCGVKTEKYEDTISDTGRMWYHGTHGHDG